MHFFRTRDQFFTKTRDIQAETARLRYNAVSSTKYNNEKGCEFKRAHPDCDENPHVEHSIRFTHDF